MKIRMTMIFMRAGGNGLHRVYSNPNGTMSAGSGSQDREFRPGWIPSLAAAAFIALTIALGGWQTRRAEEKLEAGRMLDEAVRGAGARGPCAACRRGAAFERRRVAARGTFRRARHASFSTTRCCTARSDTTSSRRSSSEGGGVHVLVNRGWIAAGERSRLPEVPTPEGVLTIEGVAVVPGTRFLELAPEAESGGLRQNLVLAREEKRLGLSLQPFVIEQTSDARDGLVTGVGAP